jgi:hypothetical protein
VIASCHLHNRRSVILCKKKEFMIKVAAFVVILIF